MRHLKNKYKTQNEVYSKTIWMSKGENSIILQDIMRKYVYPQILKGSSKNEKIFDVILQK